MKKKVFFETHLIKLKPGLKKTAFSFLTVLFSTCALASSFASTTLVVASVALKLTGLAPLSL